MRAEVVTVPSRVEDAFVLAQTMREDDVRELEACGQSPLDGVLFAMEGSESVCTMLYDDTVGAMWGVCPRGDGGELWFLTAHLFGEHPKAFLRSIKAHLKGLLQKYGTLFNVIDGRYTGALRLAESMGAEFGSPVSINGHPFVPFRIRRQ